MPCVFLTGDAGPYSAAELRACGATAVLAKPVALRRLGEAVAAAIASPG
jgi:CheY-like chemotaxis protein